MSSELLSILGALMVAIALGALWIGKMKSHAMGSAHDIDETTGVEETERSITRATGIKMPALEPIPSKSEKPADELVSADEQNESVKEQEEEPVRSPVVNCPAAENNLLVAHKLNVVGDYEGAKELAQLVIDSEIASTAQKRKASQLLGRSRTL